jgi:hypothetical protein
LFPLCLGGLQSIHKHGVCHPVGVSHPNDIRLSIRIGTGPSSSVLPCWYEHRLTLGPGSVLAPLTRCRSSMRPGFVLAPLSEHGSSVRRGAILWGWHKFSSSLLLGSVLPEEPKSSSTRFQHIPSFAGSSPSRGYEAHTLEPARVCPRDK